MDDKTASDFTGPYSKIQLVKLRMTARVVAER